MGYEVIANIYPAKDKVDIVREGLQSLAKSVQDDEPGSTRYQLYEQQNPKDGEAPQFVVVEEYADADAYAQHNRSEAMKKLIQQATSENLLAGPLDIKVVKQVGGFASR